mgnify:CR=1 FL=1
MHLGPESLATAASRRPRPGWTCNLQVDKTDRCGQIDRAHRRRGVHARLVRAQLSGREVRRREVLEPDATAEAEAADKHEDDD